MKKFILKFFVLVMMSGILSMDVSASEILYSGKDNNLSWSISTDWHLEVSGYGRPNENYWGDAEWTRYKENIVSAKIDIKDDENFNYLFDGWKKLKTVDLTKLVMSNEENTECLFEECESLEKIYVPNNLNQNLSEEDEWIYMDLPEIAGKVWIGDDGFLYKQYPSNITQKFAVTLCDIDNIPEPKIVYSGTEGNMTWSIDTTGKFVLNGSGTPKEKEWEKYVDKIYYAEINVKDITTLENFFYEFYNLISIDLSGMDASKLTNMSHMSPEGYYFEGCKLKEVKFGDIDTSNVTNMSDMFAYCWELEKVDLENLDTSNVTNMARMFAEASLKELDLSKFDMGKVKDAYAMICTYGIDSPIVNARKIHTPLNLKADVELFTESEFTIWQDEDGNVYDMLPKNMSESIILEMKPKRIEGGDGETHSGTSGDIKWTINPNGHLKVTGSGDLYFDEEEWECDNWSEYEDIIISAEYNVEGLSKTYYLFDNLTYIRELDLSKLDLMNIDVEEIDEWGITSSCRMLETIYTPVNLSATIKLPMEFADTWYKDNGDVYEVDYLPKNLATSIKLTTQRVVDKESCEIIGHSWNDDYTTDKEASCTEEGLKSIHCKKCDAIKDETKIEKKAHEYGQWITDKEPTCTEIGSKYRKCKNCDYKHKDVIAKKGHKYSSSYTIDKKASIKSDGSKSRHCIYCSAKTSVTTIRKASKISLSTTSYTYNGKTKSPKVYVKDSKGKTISSSNYTISEPSGRKNVGQYTYKIKFKNEYSGTKSLTIKINPKGTSISKLSKAKKAFTVKWKKQSAKMKSSRISGYQIQYSTSKKFKNAKTKTVSGYKSTNKKITKLKAKKTYYVRVRTYKTVKVNGKSVKLYSGWSKVKSVKTK